MITGIKKTPKLNLYQILMIGCVVAVVSVVVMLFARQSIRFNDFGDNEYEFVRYNTVWM